MMNPERSKVHVIAKTNESANGTNWTIGAGLLIVLGLALQYVQAVFTDFASQNSWFFTTLFGETWNMITIWFSTAPWHAYVQYWPLLLVVTGAAILFSHSPRKAVAANESRTGARRNA